MCSFWGIELLGRRKTFDVLPYDSWVDWSAFTGFAALGCLFHCHCLQTVFGATVYLLAILIQGNLICGVNLVLWAIFSHFVSFSNSRSVGLMIRCRGALQDVLNRMPSNRMNVPLIFKTDMTSLSAKMAGLSYVLDSCTCIISIQKSWLNGDMDASCQSRFCTITSSVYILPSVAQCGLWLLIDSFTPFIFLSLVLGDFNCVTSSPLTPFGPRDLGLAPTCEKGNLDRVLLVNYSRFFPYGHNEFPDSSQRVIVMRPTIYHRLACNAFTKPK